MPAETLIQKINQKSTAECDAILKAARSKADEIIRSAVSKAEEQADKFLSDADEIVAKTENETKQNIELQLNILKLKEKHKQLEKARHCAKQALMSMSDKSWIKLISRLIAENSPCGNIEIQIPEPDKDKYINPDFFKKSTGNDENISFIQYLENTLSNFHKKSCSISIKNTFANFDGGLMLFSDNYNVNLSFDSVLDEIFDKNIIEISDCLFNSKHGELS